MPTAPSSKNPAMILQSWSSSPFLEPSMTLLIFLDLYRCLSLHFHPELQLKLEVTSDCLFRVKCHFSSLPSDSFTRITPYIVN